MTDHERTTVRETSSDPAPVVTTTDAYPADRVRTTESTYRAGPTGGEMIRRFVMLLFGILQAALILRIILLLLVANTGNDVVSLIMNITDPFVEPFRGMFSIDRVTAGESRFDVAALVALIGWTLVEALILAALRIFSRRPADAV